MTTASQTQKSKKGEKTTPNTNAPHMLQTRRNAKPRAHKRATKKRSNQTILIVEEQPMEIVKAFVAHEPQIFEQPHIVTAPVVVEEYFLAGVITMVLLVGGLVGGLSSF